MEEGQRLIMKACNKLAEKLPYFEPVLLRFRFERNDELPTAAISPNLVVFYNSKFIKSLSQDILSGVTLHEALHFLCGHHSRWEQNPLKDQANKMLHNIAMDMEINDRLRDYGYDVGPDAVYPESFKLPDGSETNYPKGLTYEVYFKKLLNDIRSQISQGFGNKNADPNSPNTITVSMGGSNGGYDPSQKPTDDVMGGSTTETEDMVDSVKDACESASKQAGKDSNGSVDTAKVERKKYPWNVIFRNIVSKAVGPIIHGYEFKSYCAFNKKNTCQEIMLPTWRTRRNEINLVIIMDVSGSMYELIIEMYSKMKSMINMISEDIKVKILETDTEVLNVIDNFDFNANVIKYTNGGGTDMRAGWKYIYDHNLNPDLIICMTDGYTDYPSDEDPYQYKSKSVCIIDGVTENCPYKWYPSDF